MTFYQGVNEKRRYRQYISGDDTVSSATWTITPIGPTLGTPSNDTDYSMVMVSGVTAGTTYTLTPHIVGASGQEYEPHSSVYIIGR